MRRPLDVSCLQRLFMIALFMIALFMIVLLTIVLFMIVRRPLDVSCLQRLFPLDLAGKLSLTQQWSQAEFGTPDMWGDGGGAPTTTTTTAGPWQTLTPGKNTPATTTTGSAAAGPGSGSTPAGNVCVMSWNIERHDDTRVL